MISCIVLAGGKSSRMGTDKSALIFEGKTLLERTVSRFETVFDTVLVSVRKNDRRFTKYKTVEDIYEDCGPLSGLHAALSARPHGVFITAADMPFADPYLALHILKLGRSWDACIINTSCPHPLFGWYSSAVLSVAEQRLRDGQYSMTDLLKSVNTRYLSERELPQFNIGKCLLNINTPDEFIKLKNIHD